MSHLQLAAAYFAMLLVAHLGATEREPAPEPEPVTVEEVRAPEPEPAPGAERDAERDGPLVLGVHEVAYATYDVVSCARPPWAVAPQARIVPAFRDGTSVGFKLYSIRPGSIYEQLGIKNGDVLTHINGNDLTSPDKALMLYAQLKPARRFYLELERGGVPLTLTYRLAPGLSCL